MNSVNQADIVSSWIKNCLEGGSNDERFWAWEVVDDAVRNDPEQGWLLIIELVKSSPNDKVLANIAAGPLENLMNKNANEFIERIETFGRESQEFRKCLTGVWNISPWDIYQRVLALTQSVTDPL